MVEILRKGQCHLSLEEQIRQMVIFTTTAEKGNNPLMLRAAEKLGLLSDNGTRPPTTINEEGIIDEASQ